MTRPSPQDLRFSLATRRGWKNNPTALQVALVAWVKQPDNTWAEVSACKWVAQTDEAHAEMPHMGLLPRLVTSSMRAFLGHLLLPYEVIAKERADVDALLGLFIQDTEDHDPSYKNDVPPSHAIRWQVLRESYPKHLDDLWMSELSLIWEARHTLTLWDFWSNRQQEPQP